MGGTWGWGGGRLRGMETRTTTVRLPGTAGAGGAELEFEVLADDAIIGPSIAKGSWADEETRLFLAHLGPGKRALDLGANVGWFAVQAILAGAEVDAFEPVPVIADLARRNIERANEHGPGKGRLHPYAAGAEKGEARIVLAAKNHGDNRVLDESSGVPEDLGEAEEVTIRVERVDDHVKGPIDALKIDTQGSEFLALQGAKEVLAASPRLGLLLEYWPYALRGCTPRELLELLDREGFTLGKATDAPFPMKIDRIEAQVSRRDPVKGGIDLYGTRGGAPFHVLGAKARFKGFVRSLKED